MLIRVWYQTAAECSDVSSCVIAPEPITFRGSDSEGTKYASVKEIWQAQGAVSGWYDRATRYYKDNCEATIDVLGEIAATSDVDLESSREFIRELERLRSSFQWSSGAACECGAGIGRATKGLVLPLGVPRCDLVESSSWLLSASPDYLGDDASRCRFYCIGLQGWSSEPNTYSIIWIQWVLCCLTDNDAVDFLSSSRGESLVQGGIVCLKENTRDDEDFVVDVDDASVTRSVIYLKQLASKAGLLLIYERMQTNFPANIFPVPTLAFEARPR